MKKIAERAHSKFSASGAERWTACPGSVALSEGVPDKDTVWSLEGTLAHKVLELTMKENNEHSYKVVNGQKIPPEMARHANAAAGFILNLGEQLDAEVMVETRIYLDFIHPEMFGTFDGAVLDHFGTLHVFDYKYGAGHAVNPANNLQMIFYGLGLAAKYKWNFKKVRLWIIQPRIKGYDGPIYWDMTIEDLESYVSFFKKAVKTVEKNPTKYTEGAHCHWCKAKSKCPLKREAKLEKTVAIFKTSPITDKEVINGKEKSGEKKAGKDRKDQEKSKAKSEAKGKTKKASRKKGSASSAAQDFS